MGQAGNVLIIREIEVEYLFCSFVIAIFGRLDSSLVVAYSCSNDLHFGRHL
jgi:hypothetical protein